MSNVDKNGLIAIGIIAAVGVVIFFFIWLTQPFGNTGYTNGNVLVAVIGIIALTILAGIVAWLLVKLGFIKV